MYKFGRIAPGQPEGTHLYISSSAILMTRPKIFRYSLNQKLRRAANWIMRCVTTKSKEVRLDLRNEQLKKILLVRATFRMGDSILAIPAISLFRKNFPQARIDFVGAPISAKLFRNLPIDHHFSITRRYPGSAWDYPLLLRQLRSVGYDIAVDLSCSQSAMGSFIVGFSWARFRVGLRGKWDRWFNVRIPRPPERNKYRILPAFLRALGLEVQECLPSLLLCNREKQEGRQRIEELAGWDGGRPTVGVFVGGRKAWGKRWPIKNFCELITALYWQGVNVVTFFGPEEKNMIGFYSDALDSGIAKVFESTPSDFAAMVANCDLFVTCDSGPMHLACALNTRTVAIFQNPHFDHWGPPPSLAAIVYQPGGCSVEEVFKVCLEELFLDPAPARFLREEGLSKSSPSVFISRISKAVRRLEKSVDLQRLFFLSRCAQGLFFLSLIIWTWFFPPSGIFAEETWEESWMDAFIDTVGIGSLIAGGLLRLWALSHGGRCTRSRRAKTPKLLTTGPYCYIRHPIYVGNLLIGFGMIFLSEAFSLTLLFLAFFALHHWIIIPAEEEFLKEKLGEGFDLYCELVPKYIPLALPGRGFSFGRHFPLSELGTVCGIILAGFIVEWLESPLHHDWVLSVYGFIRYAFFIVSGPGNLALTEPEVYPS
jgi:ADP-heptose:LPS heptosyltransferase/protein-S-isoprenylcysteine O-methyltransferase Ste14